MQLLRVILVRRRLRVIFIAMLFCPVSLRLLLHLILGVAKLRRSRPRTATKVAPPSLAPRMRALTRDYPVLARRTPVAI